MRRRLSLAAGTDLSCSIWSPGFNTLADAVRKGVVTEAMVTTAAERLYTARMQLGFFDPPGDSPMDRIPFSSVASEQHRKVALKAAEESMVLLQNNNGALPLSKAPHDIAVVGPTADLLVSLEGNYNGQPVHPVSPLDGITKQFHGSTIHYAQGSTLANGSSVPVPRTAFGSGLRTEYFATPDWTGRPVHVGNPARDSVRLGQRHSRIRSSNHQLLGALVGHAEGSGDGQVCLHGRGRRELSVLTERNVPICAGRQGARRRRSQ